MKYPCWTRPGSGWKLFSLVERIGVTLAEFSFFPAEFRSVFHEEFRSHLQNSDHKSGEKNVYQIECNWTFESNET